MKSNWIVWGIAALVLYSIAKSAQAANPRPGDPGFVGPVLPPGYVPSRGAYIPGPGDPGFVGPVLNLPASAGGAAATNPAVNPGTLDIQTQLWDPCYSGSLVFDPQACMQSGRTTY